MCSGMSIPFIPEKKEVELDNGAALNVGALNGVCSGMTGTLDDNVPISINAPTNNLLAMPGRDVRAMPEPLELPELLDAMRLSSAMLLGSANPGGLAMTAAAVCGLRMLRNRRGLGRGRCLRKNRLKWRWQCRLLNLGDPIRRLPKRIIVP